MAVFKGGCNPDIDKSACVFRWFIPFTCVAPLLSCLKVQRAEVAYWTQKRTPRQEKGLKELIGLLGLTVLGGGGGGGGGGKGEWEAGGSTEVLACWKRWKGAWRQSSEAAPWDMMRRFKQWDKMEESREKKGVLKPALMIGWAAGVWEAGAPG